MGGSARSGRQNACRCPSPGSATAWACGIAAAISSEMCNGVHRSLSPQMMRVGWRIALFAWVTAFGFLAAYEVLSAIFRLIRR